MSNWTPAPWGLYHGRDITGEAFTEVRTQGGNGHAIVTWFDDMDDEPDATLQLIALAPEMAEALLVPHGDCEDEFDTVCSRPEDQANWPLVCEKHQAQYDARHETIRKLRAIGGDNE